MLTSIGLAFFAGTHSSRAVDPLEGPIPTVPAAPAVPAPPVAR
jgi:hypothetical protein